MKRPSYQALVAAFCSLERACQDKAAYLASLDEISPEVRESIYPGDQLEKSRAYSQETLAHLREATAWVDAHINASIGIKKPRKARK